MHPQQFSMIYAQTLLPISMPSSNLLTIVSSFFLSNLKEDSLVMGLWTWSLKKKEIFVGEDREEGKKKEKEVIGWLKVEVSCHFSRVFKIHILKMHFLKNALFQTVNPNPPFFSVPSWFCSNFSNVHTIQLFYFTLWDEFYSFGLFIYLLS